MILYYVRHGDPIYRPDSLTEKGLKQAEVLAKRFKKFGLDEIYSSPAIRAQLTAEPTCKALGIEKTIIEWAHEDCAWKYMTVQAEGERRRWGFQDKKICEIFNSREVRDLQGEWYTHPAFKDTQFGEYIQKNNAQVDEFMLSLGFEHDRENFRYKIVKPSGKKIALFAHQGMGMNVLSSILDIPYPLFCTRYDISHSSVTAIYFNEDGEYVIPKVLFLSNDSHLFKADILDKYNNMIEV